MGELYYQEDGGGYPEEVRSWLNANTVRCAVGRISRDDCERLRSRPTIKEAVESHGGKPGERELLPRPGACDRCPGWDRVKEVGMEAIEKRPAGEAVPGKQSAPQAGKAQFVNISSAMTDVKRKCARCGRELPATAEYFYRTGRGFLEGVCKDCRKSRMRAQRHGKPGMEKAPETAPAPPDPAMRRVLALIEDLRKESFSQGLEEGRRQALERIREAIGGAI